MTLDNADGPDPLAALLERAEHYIYLATALILVAAAAALLCFAVVEVTEETIAGDYSAALLHLLDRTLLVLMLAEIIYTVRSIARRHRLEAEPFFIVAIIAAIRRILVITPRARATSISTTRISRQRWSSWACWR